MSALEAVPPETDVATRLGLIYASRWPDDVNAVLFSVDSANGAAFTLDQGFELLAQSAHAPPHELVPLCVVDDDSLATVLVDGPDAGLVLRWHLGAVHPRHQGQLLDVDPLLYIAGLADELAARTPGLARILDEIGPAYKQGYLARERRPRDFVVRPIRIACQNVIVGLAAVAQESTFDGLAVVAWQTCEVPHVATHEGNRALAALVLCDAFQNGGTMEIRFDRPARVVANRRTFHYQGHPEGQVPASLKRYGRTVGVALGDEDPAAITPREARELFAAVTPMRAGLQTRVMRAVASAGIAPEPLYFALLSGVWREIELDWMLAVSSRAASILSGGADWQRRVARQAEMDVCRTAAMAGMLFARLEETDNVGGGHGGPRVVEDQRNAIDWQVDPEAAAIVYTGHATDAPLPWMSRPITAPDGRLIVLPRTAVTDQTRRQARALVADGATVAVLLARDAPDPAADDLLCLRCPDRLTDLDKAVEGKLLTSRISRT